MSRARLSKEEALFLFSCLSDDDEDDDIDVDGVLLLRVATIEKQAVLVVGLALTTSQLFPNSTRIRHAVTGICGMIIAADLLLFLLLLCFVVVVIIIIVRLIFFVDICFLDGFLDPKEEVKWGLFHLSKMTFKKKIDILRMTDGN